jgi:hypothetical protein
MRLAEPLDCTTAAEVYGRIDRVMYLRRTLFRRLPLPPPAPPMVVPRRAFVIEVEAVPVPPPLSEPPVMSPEEKEFADYLAELRLIARPTGIRLIVHITARYFQVSTKEVLGRSRFSRLVKPRHVAIYLAKKVTGRSLPDIARYMDNRDHTSILHAVRRIESKLAENDPHITAAVEAITIELGKVMAQHAAAPEGGAPPYEPAVQPPAG